jgi:hypothetical protein
MDPADVIGPMETSLPDTRGSCRQSRILQVVMDLADLMDRTDRHGSWNLSGWIMQIVRDPTDYHES